MPEYESCEWSQATHVANADRSIVRKMNDRGISRVSFEVVGAVDIDMVEFLGFEPVKEKKVEWMVQRQSIWQGIMVSADARLVSVYSDADLPLAEKICRLLNEEDKRNELC